MSNASGFAALDAMIERVESVPNMAREAAPEVAEAVDAELRRTIAAGTTPAGKAWEPKKVGTGKPLANAAKALRVVAVGSRVFATLTGPEARHHLGRAKGGTVREVLPVSEIPPRMAGIVRETLEAHFRRVAHE